MFPQDTLLHRQLDEYRIEALLGRGGMARVYRGLDVRLNRRVAIKVIEKSYRAHEDYLKRFKQEAQAVARLEHPHIVRLYRYGEIGDLVYMAMQYIEGPDLAALLQRYRAEQAYMEVEEVVRLIREIGLGLDYAHSLGVIHRDIKPSNIMINRAGHAVITDFGLAMLSEVNTLGHVLGSPRYLSPEQAISSARVVPQSDLYSVGIMLYEMFTGTVPFEGDEPLKTAMMHIQLPVPLPSTRRPEISREIERVILKSLDKNPAQRYQTGAELSHALEKAVASPEGDTAKSLPTAPPFPPIEERPPVPPTIPPSSARAAVPVQGPASPPVPPPFAPIPQKPARRFPLTVGTGALLLGVFLCISLLAGSFWAANRFGSAPPALASPTLSATPPNSPSPTQLPTLTPLPPSITPTSTSTATPSPTFSPTPTSTGAPVSTSFELLFLTENDDSLVIVNTGETALPLPPLNLRVRNNILRAELWEVDLLQPGECVIAVKDTGNPVLPEVECEEVGERLFLSPGERIWSKTFEVYYGRVEVETCEKDEDTCEVFYGNEDD